jgi:hypothetical protein
VVLEPPALKPRISFAAFKPGDRVLLAVVDVAGAEMSKR